MLFVQAIRRRFVAAPSWLVIAGLCACSVLWSADAASGQQRFDPAKVEWQTLDYQARKWTIKARSRLHFAPAPSDVSRLRKPASGSATTAPSRALWTLKLESEYLGREELDQVWLHALDGAALQRTSADDDHKKTYRFTDTGVWVLKESLDSKDKEDWFVEYPSGVPECATVSEPGILFYLLAVAPPAEGEVVKRCIYAKKGVHRLEIRHVGPVKVDVDFQEVQADGRSRRRKAKVSALRYAIRTEFLGSSRDIEDGAALRLLGLEGDLEIDMEPGLGFPLQVSGDLPRFGAVTVKLQRAKLR